MGYFQFSFYFHFPFLFFFDFDVILHDIELLIIKMKINVPWEMPVTSTLSWAPQTFRTMDRWSGTNKSLRKGLAIGIVSVNILIS